MRIPFISSCLIALIVAAPSSAGPVATGFASDNVEHIATVPFDAGLVTGARLVGDFLYVAGSKTFSIYDVSDPLEPQLMSITPIGFQFAAEDVDTNGKILLLSDEQGATQALHIWDVEDKSAPVKVTTVEGAPDHTFTCVLGCKWAYGAGGTIVDLRDPASAKVVGRWGSVAPGFGFDVTEVAPGLVLTASREIMLMDARRDPTKPRILASGTTSDNRLIHSNRWPRLGKDRFFLVQGETFAETRCDDDSGAMMTWDTRNWKKTRNFQLIDEFRMSNGAYVDGSPTASAFGCTAMWFQEHPDFHNGGLVAAGFFEHGTRFLEVDHEGQIKEVGYFLPAGGSTVATYWLNSEIVYALDIQRGIDILRFSG